ncbi:MULTISPECIES: hypothetical protein [Cupriavidus]|uniref:hypothetical protein n=1 Tax=Cupriavidus sp. WS TaxID=1312922 RepID=UPI0003A45BFB|nr:hypothetical protein [Cupriavidus sp. WS]
MKKIALAGAGLMALSCSLSALAGPDFAVIEKAREAKRAQQHAAVSQPVATTATTTQASVTPRGVVYKHEVAAVPARDTIGQQAAPARSTAAPQAGADGSKS